MDLLIDTHSFLWLNYAEEKIPEDTVKILADNKNRIFLSSISIWEICQKYALGKLKLHLEPKLLISHSKRSFGIEIINFSENDSYHLSTLPPLHKDPFDRMLICQAIENNMAIVTDDRMISSYPIKVIW